MDYVTMLDAKTNLSRLVEAVESGVEAEIVIAGNGKPAARLMPMPKRKPIRLGLAEGKYAVPGTVEEFNAHDEEIAAMFNDGPIFPAEPH